MREEIIIYLVTVFVLGGTNVWTIIMYISERRKRKLEEKGQQLDVDAQEFNNLKQQLEYSDERIKMFYEQLTKMEKVIVELRSNLLKEQQLNSELQLKLTDVEAKYKRIIDKACMKASTCELRIQPQ